MNQTNEQAETLVEFPCTFPLKIMGLQHPDFASTILSVIQQHAPETEDKHITTRPSSKGNYVGATAQVYVTNKEQLDNIYRALTSHPMVKVVL
ncbi:MAG: DUF493 domain-containing protein [Neisseria sp.]|nr:DUF493 domain-containing protein [Neisseria sp.]